MDRDERRQEGSIIVQRVKEGKGSFGVQRRDGRGSRPRRGGRDQAPEGRCARRGGTRPRSGVAAAHRRRRSSSSAPGKSLRLPRGGGGEGGMGRMGGMGGMGMGSPRARDPALAGIKRGGRAKAPAAELISRGETPARQGGFGGGSSRLARAELVGVERIARDELQAIAEAARQLDARRCCGSRPRCSRRRGCPRRRPGPARRRPRRRSARRGSRRAPRQRDRTAAPPRSGRRHEVAHHRLAVAVREVDVQRVARAERARGPCARPRRRPSRTRSSLLARARDRWARARSCHAAATNGRAPRRSASLVARVEDGLPVRGAVVGLAAPAQIEAGRRRLEVEAVIGA